MSLAKANSSFFAPKFLNILFHDLSCIFLHFSRKTSYTFFFLASVVCTQNNLLENDNSVPFSTGVPLNTKSWERVAPKEVIGSRSGGQRREKGSIFSHDSLLFLPLFAKWCLEVGILGSTAVIRLLPNLSGSPRTYSENCHLSEQVMIG